MAFRRVFGHLSTLAFSGLTLLAACGGNDAPAAFSDPDLEAAATNPDGVPYPQDHLGSQDRAGSRRGDRLPNLAFQGYVDGDRGAGLKTVSMADFYDPEAVRHRILFVQVSATWCVYCASLSEDVVRSKDALAAEGAAFIEVVINGNEAKKGPSLAEVDQWIARHQVNYTTVLDVEARRMAGLGVSDVPWTMLVDTRSMEILDSSAGSPVDASSYVREGLAWSKTHASSY